MRTHAHAEPVSARDEVALYLAALSFVAAIIHLVASAIHVEHIWWYGAFFAVLSGFQLAWGLRVSKRPSPRVLTLGAVVSAGAVAIWIVSRTIGIPFGPEAFEPEALGAIDVGAVVDEVAIIALAAASVRAGGAPTFGSAARLAIYAVLTLTSLTLFVGGAHHH